ncbi:MAG: sensor histidine kinase N-terminal domain-containing protein [Pseudomonadota bacterium]
MYANSLRRLLLKKLLWPLIVILLLGSAFAYFFALDAAMNAHDLGLLDNALDLSKQIEVHQGEMVISLPPAAQQMLQANNEDRVVYAAWDDMGSLFAGSPKLLRLGTFSADENHVFRDIVLDGEQNRAVILRGNSAGRTYYIAVSQTTRGRGHLTDSIFVGILIPEALLALVSIAVIILGVRQGLSPVELLRDEITSRSSTDLRPIDEMPAPAELVPIIHGINELLGNLATSFASHRRFIADAAHQLRTPLASLSSQIEVGMEEPPVDVKELLRQLLLTTKRTTHLANQLLSLARLEHTEQSMHEIVSVELDQIISDATADFVTPAARKPVELEFDVHPCRMQGSPLMLRELVANLLDNAIRYTPPHGRVIVGLQLYRQALLLTVEDNGPGVAAAELDKLGIPFYRLTSSQPDGCGLGLAIVKEIARLHNADVMFSSGRGGLGLRVAIKFHNIPASNAR